MGFLAEKGQRAVAHPLPSLKRCYVITDPGRLLFDVATDQGIAKGLHQSPGGALSCLAVLSGFVVTTAYRE